MDVRVSSLHETTEVVCASPRVGQRRVPLHHGCVGRLFMRTREEEVTLEVILYAYSRRMNEAPTGFLWQRQRTATGANRRPFISPYRVGTRIVGENCRGLGLV